MERITYSREQRGTYVLRQNLSPLYRLCSLLGCISCLNSWSIWYRQSCGSDQTGLNQQPWQELESLSTGGQCRLRDEQSLKLTNLSNTMQKSRKVDITRQSTSRGRLAGYLKGTQQVIVCPMISHWQQMPLMLTKAFRRAPDRKTNSSKCLNSLVQASTFSPVILYSLWAGKMVNSAMSESGSSRSRSASTNSGQRSRTRWLRLMLGLCLARQRMLPTLPLALAFLNLRRCTFCARIVSMIGSRARKLMSLTWQKLRLVLLSFLGGSRGQTPLRMHSLLKSLRLSCSLRMALALLMYLTTSPRLPALIFRIDC